MIPITPPGNTIIELLDQRGMTKADLAEKLGLTTDALEAVCNGKLRIGLDVAEGLEKHLAHPASFWLRREDLYRTYLWEFFRENVEGGGHQVS